MCPATYSLGEHVSITTDVQPRVSQAILERFAECNLADAGWRARAVERWVLTIREQIGLVHRLAMSPASVAPEELTEALQRLRSDMREAENLSVLSAQLTGKWAGLKHDLEMLVEIDSPIDPGTMRRAVDPQALFRSEK